ncbi:MAG TPA: O-methyltransferase, partial [Tepidisphaeraceae bacterium]|nr:O-methyltransferase [Tepidisphaeraceae bacterium]
IHPDESLDAALKDSFDAGLPAINVAPGEGKLLHLLALMSGAKRVLEIGTLGGYSTIWLARAVGEDGKVVTLEKDSKNADVARLNLKRAGLLDRVEVRVGLALDSLKQMAMEKLPPFNLFFIDADKGNNPNYVDWALKFSKPGSVIVLDNVVRNGGVLLENSNDPDIVGTRAALEKMGNDPRLTSTVIQTVSSKGYDGMAIGVVR